MEDLQGALQSILSDPEQMEQIMAMANALGLRPPVSSAEGREQGGAPPAAETQGGNPSGGAPIDPAVLRLLGGIGDLHGPEAGVLNALRPVLSDPSRVDRALRAARLSRLAGQLLRERTGHV